MNTDIAFTAPPTVADFMCSTAFFRVILGPVGSGKTTGCIFELLRRCVEQRPAPDGIRYTRWAVVRQTLKQLIDTVLKDVLQWLGKIATWKVSDKTVTVKFGDVYSEWIFIPLEDTDDQRRLLSMQLTGAWMSEAIEMDVNLVGAILGRCGRYPSAVMGGCTWFGAVADTNFPSEGSPWHQKLEMERPDNWSVFKQPGGMEPDAENLEWLTQTPETLKLPVDHPDRRVQGKTYYINLLSAGNEDWVKRYVHAQYGNDPSGSAVYRTSFKREIHVVDELYPVQGHNLIIAQDFGRNPWALITQVDHRQRLLVLEEIEAEDMGLVLHIQQNLRPALMDERYLGLSYFLIGDPAGVARDSITEDSPFSVLKKAGYQAYPAPSNNIEPRLSASEGWLIKRYADGPGCLIDGSRCPKLVRALSGEYRFTKRKNGQLNVVPDKSHPWSDVADCFQYASMVAGSGLAGFISNRITRQNAVSLVGQGVRRRSSRGWT